MAPDIKHKDSIEEVGATIVDEGTPEEVNPEQTPQEQLTGPNPEEESKEEASTSQGGSNRAKNVLGESQFRPLLRLCAPQKTHEQYIAEMEPDPEKAQKILDYERTVIELQRTRFKDEYCRSYNQMILHRDQQEYVFYEIHEAAFLTAEMLKFRFLKGFKVDLLGLCCFDKRSSWYFLVSHDAKDKTVKNPDKVILNIQKLKEPPFPGQILRIKGVLYWPRNRHVVLVENSTLVQPAVVKQYAEFLREAKRYSGLKEHCAAKRGFDF